ncbi:MAG: acyloxyacyl hydrolase [Chthoniobacterales bacterium]
MQPSPSPAKKLQTIRSRFFIVLVLCLCAGEVFAGMPAGKDIIIPAPSRKLFEVDVESAQMFNIDNNPNRYYFSTQMISFAYEPFSALKIGPVRIRTQLLATFYASAIIRGPENFYFGGGPQIRFILPFGDTPWSLFAGLGCGAGGANAHPSHRDDHGLGQPFTFILLSNWGFRYQVNKEWSVWVGSMWHHLSNANMSTAHKRNTGPDEIGVLAGAGYAF